MERVLLFIIFFIIIYIVYWFLYVRKQIKYEKKKVSSDLKILEIYYKVNVKKIGYQKVLRILNFVNSLMLATLMMIIVNLDKFIYKFLVALVLMLPLIWVTYYFLAKYLKYLERKSEKDV